MEQINSSAAISTGVSGEHAKVTEPGVSIAVNFLKSEREALLAAVGRLNERLSVVLCEPEPAPDKNPTDIPCSCKLQQVILEECSQLHSAISMLTDITDRIEL